MSDMFRTEILLSGGLIIANLLVAIALFRLHTLLQRIYLSGLLTGRADG